MLGKGSCIGELPCKRGISVREVGMPGGGEAGATGTFVSGPSGVSGSAGGAKPSVAHRDD